VSQPDFVLSRFVFEDVVNVSSSDTDEALELLRLVSGCNDSPRPTLNDAWVTSSESSTSSDWFEDWPEANDMAASIYVALTAKPSPLYKDRGQASCRSRDLSSACSLKIALMSGDQQLV
jgi:hypothetical protein